MLQFGMVLTRSVRVPKLEELLLVFAEEGTYKKFIYIYCNCCLSDTSPLGIKNMYKFGFNVPDSSLQEKRLAHNKRFQKSISQKIIGKSILVYIYIYLMCFLFIITQYI